MKLSQLQRLGISKVLEDYMYHCDYSINKGGTIEFTNNVKSDTTNMYVKCYNGKKLSYTLNHEFIDDLNEYAFQWDASDKIFHIIDIERKEEPHDYS